jgi:hypothetical protein
MVGGAPYGAGYVVDLPITRVPRPPGDKGTCGGRYAWARRLGGVMADSVVGITITNDSSEVAVLSEFRAIKKEAQPPRRGSYIGCILYPPVPVPVTGVWVLLSRRGEPEVYFRLVPRGVGRAALVPAEPTADLAIQIKPGESESLHVYPEALDCDCTWVGKLDLIVGGRIKTVSIDDHGKPFETTSPMEGQLFAWNGKQWAAGEQRVR